jgi:hypothetical protein
MQPISAQANLPSSDGKFSEAAEAKIGCTRRRR